VTVLGDGLAFARCLADTLKTNTLIEYPRFGTAMIPFNDTMIEIATARTESYQSQSRKPDVTAADLHADLARRDFTINAMAMALNGAQRFQVEDHFESLKDLNAGLLRTPMEPRATFSEDPLRMLRAIRFATQLGFRIDPATFSAIEAVRERIAIVSQERITDELTKILMSGQTPSVGFGLLRECGLLAIVLPEIDALDGVEQRDGFHHKDVFWHSLQVVDNVCQVSPKFELRLTALLHDVAKPATKKYLPGKGWTFHGHEDLGAKMAVAIGHRLKLSNRVIDYVAKLIQLHLRPIALATEGVTDSAVRRLIVDAGDDLDDLILLGRADITSKNPRKVATFMGNFDRVVQLVQEVRGKDAMRAFQSPVRGDEIMQYCNLTPGPMVGYIKKAIEEAILNGEIENTYDAAHSFLVNHCERLMSEFLHG